MSRTGGRNSAAHFLAPESKRRPFLRARGRSARRSRPNRKGRQTLMSQKTVHTVGVIMNGVTGRMGLNQHLRRSLYAIMQQGGLRLSDSEAIMPRPLLVGRNAAKLEAISAECGGLPWTTDLDAALANSEY